MATDETTPRADAFAPRYQGETKEHLAAFQLYVSMGNKRSIAAVAEQMKLSDRTVTSWSKKYEWRLRLQQIQEEESDRAQEQIKEQYFEDAENLRKYKYELLELMKAKIAVDHFCGECNAHKATVGEIISVFNVIKTELGEPTSIAKGTFTEDKANPFAGIFNSFFGKKDEPAASNA